MQTLAGLTKGLKIIEPFLKQHQFEFDNYQNGKDSSGEFTVGIYTNKRKKFLVDYRFSIGQVLYQFDHSIISHPFYLDQLGFADKKRLTDFLSDDKPEVFDHILHDFNFLVDDFFEGECIRLREFAKLQDNVIIELDKEIREENNIRFDIIKIEKARQKFRMKDFPKALELYGAVGHKNLLNDLDEKIMEHCERHV